MSNHPVFYSFRRCPYAMRARWALLEAGLLVQWREIDLKTKPVEMLEVSPKGTVPVLVLNDGTVIDESLEVMNWALKQADPRGLLNTPGSTDLISENDGPFKHHLDRFKYSDRYPNTSKDDHRDAGLAILRRWNDRIAADGWLMGEQITLADAALWPFVRQWRIADPVSFDADPTLTSLRTWLSGFLDNPMFQRLMQRADPWSPNGLQPHFPADAVSVPNDQPLFHLALSLDWTAAQTSGVYRTSTRGLTLEQVGFIHCSWEEQVSDTYERFYRDLDQVLLLKLDPDNLEAPLRADAGPNGELFPHVYGPLQLNAIRQVSTYPS